VAIEIFEIPSGDQERSYRVARPMTCTTCQGARWVCEAHADRPWNDHPNACRYGEPGMPCLLCNAPQEGERPALPTDFTPHFEIDKGPIQ
jgi:hypothetical protein